MDVLVQRTCKRATRRMAEELLVACGVRYSLFVIRYSFKANSKLLDTTLDVAILEILRFSISDLTPLPSMRSAGVRQPADREGRPRGVGPPNSRIHE